MTIAKTHFSALERHAALQPQKDETMPERIQRKRTKGFRMPSTATYVGRGTKWGNPYKVMIAPKGMVGAHPMSSARYAVVDTRPDAPNGNYKLFMTFHDAARYAVGQYRHVWLPRQDFDLSELAGRDLACWCALTADCHADALLAAAANIPLPVEA